ncbi:GTPase domain-containing protein [Methylomagnum ishizawai]|uniref:GTPase domain-containing protein n=1 Tax=Methylomagnum ishizawai TaxID=1760988 RepID=UPI001C322AEE|nr:GTPase domain-containing protein [Methylomagnum ishizawai]BBL77488.1 hypothetical protein MishRS11D_45860 [Methylomagnum ishizawai]
MSTQKTEYKKFTAEIHSGTLLDDFMPQIMDDLEKRYKPINDMKIDYCDVLSKHAINIDKFNGFEKISEALSQSVEDINNIFVDIDERMKYFTIVFFGGVSAGKTSMICDLANVNPHHLSEIISSNPNFNPAQDRISIGPNVATINLYEILIEKSCIRLVDVPGIGGVVHDDDSLAPFVNMADCIMLLIQAGNDIMKSDEDFLYDHVAAFSKRDTSNAEFKSEERTDKRVLVALNKWKMAYGDLPPAKADKIFEQKSEWILHANGLKANDKFSGIAGYFHKPPIIARAETSYRDDETGDPLPAWFGENAKTDLSEVINALHEILKDDGSDFRLNRPRQVLQKESNKLIGYIAQEKAATSLEELGKELESLGVKSTFTTNQINDQLIERLNRFEQTVTFFLASRIKPAIHSWQPKVGFFDGLTGIFNKKGLQESLKKEWSNELRNLISSRIDVQEFANLIKQETDAFKKLVETSYQINFLSNPDLLKRIPGLQQSSSGSSSSEKEGIFKAIERELDEAVKKIQMGILDDIINLVSWDAILAILVGAILSPVGSFLLLAYRRWKRGESKGQEAKREIDYAVDKIAADVSSEIKQKIMLRLQKGVEDIHVAISNVLKQEKETINEPLILMDQIIADIREFQIKLQSIGI